MAEEIRVEQLKPSDRAEAFEVITQAFQDTPQPTIYTKSRIVRVVRVLMSAIYRLLGKNVGMRVKRYIFYEFTNLLLYGIRKDSKLVCVAVLADSENRPKKSPILSRIVLRLIAALFFLVFQVGRIFRWQMVTELEGLSEEMPECYKGRYLELIKFGTLPAYQKQGIGREMLCFIRKKAESEGYKGISLGATRDTPAFHLYTKEGFTVVHDLNIAQESVVLMQLIFRNNEAE